MTDQIDPETGEVRPGTSLVPVDADPDFEDVGAPDGGESEGFVFTDLPPFNPEIMSLMGDLRDQILARIKSMPTAWSLLTKQEQVEIANGVEYEAREIIKGVVRAVNKHEWPHAVVSLGQVTIKGEKGIEAKIECANIEHNRNVLGDHVGQHVMIMMVDSDTFMAAKAEAQTDGAQMELPLGSDEGLPGFDQSDDEAAAA